MTWEDKYGRMRRGRKLKESIGEDEGNMEGRGV